MAMLHDLRSLLYGGRAHHCRSGCLLQVAKGWLHENSHEQTNKQKRKKKNNQKKKKVAVLVMNLLVVCSICYLIAKYRPHHITACSKFLKLLVIVIALSVTTNVMQCNDIYFFTLKAMSHYQYPWSWLSMSRNDLIFCWGQGGNYQTKLTKPIQTFLVSLIIWHSIELSCPPGRG